MILGILAEQNPETRVAVTPDAIPTLKGYGFTDILLERGAGGNAYFSDDAYKEKGGTPENKTSVIQKSDLLVCIGYPSQETLAALRPEQAILGMFGVLGSPSAVESLKDTKATAFSLDLLPRSTRAQAMDVLSSMATVAGYQAVLRAATELPGFFPLFMTAAGTIKPAKVLIIGAGVAGLQAVSTARKLGAVVEAFDVRSAAKEEVLSLGAKFVDVEGAAENAAAGGYAIEQTEEYKQKQAEAVHKHAQMADVIICTAQIPGRKAPLIIQPATVQAMKPGSVIIDLAASTGGNCAFTENGKTVEVGGVKIFGDSALPSQKPRDASFMFSKNVQNFLKLLVQKGEMKLNWEDDIILNTCICHEGQIKSPRLLAAR